MNAFEVKNELVVKILEHLERVLYGKRAALVRILACIFGNGHLLLEDLPGLGKTTMAVALARALGLRFGRVQCTNDLLPTDVTGLNVFKADRSEFEFHPGPIFNNLVLVDEINRATPKTQSALLEAMGEEQATIDGKTYALPKPFLVIATQNPVEFAGTFPLPESQMDRFMMRISLGYPDRRSEMDILKSSGQRALLEGIPPLLGPDKVVAIQSGIERSIAVSDKIIDYILTLAERTRQHPLLAAGISTRGATVLMKSARCAAWMRGRDYVIPEDVRVFANDVLQHRLQLANGAKSGAAEVLRSIMDEVSPL